MNADLLKARTKEFGLRAIKLVAALPLSQTGKILGSQLLRSATSVGANYRAALRARSKAEFVAKLGIVEEEADESIYWLELVTDSGLLKPQQTSSLIQEAKELTAIVVATIRTTKSKLKAVKQ